MVFDVAELLVSAFDTSIAGNDFRWDLDPQDVGPARFARTGSRIVKVVPVDAVSIPSSP